MEPVPRGSTERSSENPSPKLRPEQIKDMADQFLSLDLHTKTPLDARDINAPPSRLPAKADQTMTEAVVAQLKEMNKKMDTITQTVLFMEKRLSLVEEQMKLLSDSRK